MTSYPTATRYDRIMQMPAGSRAFCEPLLDDLRQGEFLKPPKAQLPGSLIWGGGSFAVVFKCRTNVGEHKAVRCYIQATAPNALAHSDALNAFRRTASGAVVSHYFVDSLFIQEGVRADGEWFPVNMMEWIEGDTLDKKVRSLAEQQKGDQIRQLADSVLRMVVRLQEAKFAHGDFAPSNIMLQDDLTLRLVDYDTFYVPSLAGGASSVLGQPGYIHPKHDSERRAAQPTSRAYSPFMDTFAAVVLLVSLYTIAENHLFGNRHTDVYFVFTQEDLASPATSPTFSEVKSFIRDDKVQKLLPILEWLCAHDDACERPLRDILRSAEITLPANETTETSLDPVQEGLHDPKEPVREVITKRTPIPLGSPYGTHLKFGGILLVMFVLTYLTITLAIRFLIH